MLQFILNQIMERFNAYLALQGLTPGQADFPLVLEDISKHENQPEPTGNSGIQNSLVLTLANIEEETALKNNYPMQQVGSSTIEKKPVLHINMYLLFAAHFDNYNEALKQISFVLEFFQATPTLKFQNPSNGSKYELYFNIHNLGYENMNNLWVVLGGKYLPSILYKCRLIAIQAAAPIGGTSISQVDTSGTNL